MAPAARVHGQRCAELLPEAADLWERRPREATSRPGPTRWRAGGGDQRGPRRPGVARPRGRVHGARSGRARPGAGAVDRASSPPGDRRRAAGHAGFGHLAGDGLPARPGRGSAALRATGRPARATAPCGRLAHRLRRGLADLRACRVARGARRRPCGAGRGRGRRGAGDRNHPRSPRAPRDAGGGRRARRRRWRRLCSRPRRRRMARQPGLRRRHLLVPLRRRRGPASRGRRARAAVGQPRPRPGQLAGSGRPGSGCGHPSAGGLEGQRLGLVVGANGELSVPRRRTARRVLRPGAAHRPSPG